MAYQKLQSREALNVIPSDTVRIPDPSSVVVIDPSKGSTVGVADFSVLNTLTDVGTKFTEAGILPGAIIYKTTGIGTAYSVVSVDSDTQLTISGPAAGTAADSYSIYTAATNGCTLYVGRAGNINVRMAEQNGNTSTAAAPANQTLSFNNLADATFMPIQVVQVLTTSTSAKNIIAMW